MNNASPPPFYRDCWHEVSRDLFATAYHSLRITKELYNQSSLLHSRDIAGSHFACIVQYSSLLPSIKVRAIFKPDVADRPLRPAMDNGLGEPLPPQLPNPYRLISQLLLHFYIFGLSSLIETSITYTRTVGKFLNILTCAPLKTKLRTTSMC